MGWMDDLQCMTRCLWDGWMTCDFTSFSTVYQSYQDKVDNETLCAMELCLRWSRFRLKRGLNSVR